MLKVESENMFSFEGGEGSGKSTIIQIVKEMLETRGYRVFVTREPGGCETSEEIRNVIMNNKNKDMDVNTELFLFMAARNEHWHKVIKPHLQKGEIVLCDRFIDSTFAYQTINAKDVDAMEETINTAHKLIFNGRKRPKELLNTFYLRLDDVSTGLERIKKNNREENRFDERTLQFHELVKENYDKIFSDENCNVKIVDADRDAYIIANEVYREIHKNITVNEASNIILKNIREGKEDSSKASILKRKILKNLNIYAGEMEDSVLDMMASFYAHFNQNKANNMEIELGIRRRSIKDLDYEYESLLNSDANKMYNIIGWNKKASEFDINYSFWRTFKAGMNILFPNENIFKENYSAQCLFENSKSDSTTIRNLNHFEDKVPEIKEFASICYTVANFLPIPDRKYNFLKNKMGYDFLCLYIEAIEKRYKEFKKEQEFINAMKDKISIKLIFNEEEFKEITEIRNWFIKKQEDFGLQDEYIYDEINDELNGIALFVGQTLENPFPKDIETYREMLKTIIERIKNRALIISDQYILEEEKRED
jgi:dTMP kinase